MVDEHVYTPTEIQQKIRDPKAINSRGTYAIPELKGNIRQISSYTWLFAKNTD